GRPGRSRMTPRRQDAAKRIPDFADERGGAYDDGTRRTEILQTAASLIASSGLRTSLKEIADACGILPGSLYHHFESKEAIIVELVERYRADLDAVAAPALGSIDADARPVEERVVALGSAIAAGAVRHRAALLLTLYDPPSGASDQ